MKYLFGPVNSRRLGLSQGIDLLPPKICTFNCIFCEIGPTTNLTCELREYTPTSEIIAEIDLLLAGSHPPIDVFTITASGEPALHTGLAQIIAHLKQKTAKPVAVLTNGSLLYRQEVRQALQKADIVIPSLDAALETSFRKINRPAECVNLTDIISGLVQFVEEFKGEVWLEILLIKGINDSPAEIAALSKAVAEIQPDKIQLNTVARPPLESYAAPLGEKELQEISRQLPGPVEIIVDFTGRKGKRCGNATAADILAMLQRRPCTESDICEALNLDQVRPLLDSMLKKGDLTRTMHSGKTFYEPK
jgi:wyosine [tRNA(Phe)-imidazoG37] synthetase (radical SAM superfamily)